MASSDEQDPAPAFHETAALVLDQIGVTRAATIRGGEQLVNELSLGLPRDEADDLGDLLARAGTSDSPVLLVPPWGWNPEGERDWSQWRVGDHPVAVLVPAGVLARRLPKRVLGSGSPTTVVVGRLEVPSVHGEFQAALVVFHPRPDVPLIRFFSIPPDTPPALVTQDFRRLLSQDGGSTEFGFVIRGADLTGCSLRPQDHDPAITRSIDDLANFGAGGVVEDVFDVLRPRMSRQVPDLPESTRVVRGRDLGRDGYLRPSEEGTALDAPPPTQPLRFGGVNLQTGDLLLSEVERPGHPRPPVQIRDNDLPATASPGVMVLRPRVSLTEQHREFYRYYLASQRFRVVMRAHGGGGITRMTQVHSAPLPHPDDDLVDALTDLQRARHAFRSWAEEGDDLSAEAFEGSATESRRKLIDSGRLLRQREEAARAVGSFDHRVANFYPTPIAAQFREVRVRQSAGTDEATLRAVLECSETALAFTAAVALAFAWTNELVVGAMTEIRSKLSRGNSGVSMGDWVNVLKEVSSGKTFRGVPDDAPLAAIRSALPENSAAAEAQERLKRRRDSESHLRGADEFELAEVVEESMKDLEVLLEHLAFLADLPVFHVESTRWDSIRQTGSAKVRWLRGDHPMSLIESMDHRDPSLEEGSLYVRDLNGTHVLLRPFVVRLQCQKCRTWSTFCPDDRKQGRLRLKALDHSHSVDAEASLDALKTVGYVQ